MQSTSDGLILLYFSCFTRYMLHVIINRLYVIFFSPCRSLLGLDHLIVFSRTKPFLLTIPDLISFCSSELLGLHDQFFHFQVYTLNFSLLGLHVRSSSNDTFFASFRTIHSSLRFQTIHSSFKRKKVGEGIRNLDPWRHETYFT